MKVEWDDFSPWEEDLATIKSILLQKVNILYLLDLYGVEYSGGGSNDFTHKAICPFKFHKGGDERTPSFYISQTTNSFYCFGCQSKSNVIDFVQLYEGISFSMAIEKLCKIAGLTRGDLEFVEPPVKRPPEETIKYYVVRAGNGIRKFLKTKEGTKHYESWSFWADEKFKKLDGAMDKLSDDNWEKAKNYCDQAIYNKIKRG